MFASDDDLLQEAHRLLRAGDKDRALALAKAVLVEDRSNVNAWLVAALAAPDHDEARVALQVVLKLQPDHAQARALLARLDAAAPSSAPSASATQDDAIAGRRPAPRVNEKRSRRSGCIGRRNLVTLAIIGLSLAVISGGAMAFIWSLTGNPALEQIDQNLPVLGRPYPTARPHEAGDGARPIAHDSQIRDSINDGEVQRFRFQGRHGTEVFIGLGLIAVPSDADTTGAMELFDPDGYRVVRSAPDAADFDLPALPVLDTGNVSIIQTTLDRDGLWELRLIGRAGRSAGAYFLLMQCYPEDGCRPPLRSP